MWYFYIPTNITNSKWFFDSFEHALNKPNLKIYPNRYRYCYISTYRQIPQIRFLISPSERESPGIVRIKENGDGWFQKVSFRPLIFTRVP